MNSGNTFMDTLMPYLGGELPELIALLVAIVLVAVNWSKDRRRAVMGVGAFVLALLCVLAWPVAVATSDSLITDQFQVAEGLWVNGISDFVLRALTGLAWLLIVVALFPGRKPSTP